MKDIPEGEFRGIPFAITDQHDHSKPRSPRILLLPKLEPMARCELHGLGPNPVQLSVDAFYLLPARMRYIRVSNYKLKSNVDNPSAMWTKMDMGMFSDPVVGKCLPNSQLRLPDALISYY